MFAPSPFDWGVHKRLQPDEVESQEWFLQLSERSGRGQAPNGVHAGRVWYCDRQRSGQFVAKLRNGRFLLLPFFNSNGLFHLPRPFYQFSREFPQLLREVERLLFRRR